METLLGLCCLSALAVTGVSSSYLRDENICGKPLCKDPKSFKFTPEYQYSYKYEARVNTTFDVEKENASSLLIKAVVALTFATPCHGTLQVSELTMGDGEEEDENEEFLDAFSEHNLRFYYEDGRFTELCPDKQEPVPILNFKKGILSSFQNSMERLDLDEHTIEIDVNGECLTNYRLEAVDGTTLIISKDKELATCARRHQLHSLIPTSSYVFHSKYHRWSPMVSNLTCKQWVDHNIVTEVQCSETHSFLPFYNQSLGASTTATISISLMEEEEVLWKDIFYNQKKVLRRGSLLYDGQTATRESDKSLAETTAFITSLCHLDTEERQPEFSEIFNKLIHVARYLPYDSLSNLYNTSESLCPSGKKHVLDGLPHLRSSASVQLMTHILLTEPLPAATVNQFFFSITVFNRPDVENMRALRDLVMKRSGDMQAMLAASSLIHSYCQHQRPPCHGQVRDLVAHWEQALQHPVFPDLNQAIGILKALGNAGVQTPTLVTTLQKLIKRQDLPLELRIAAISAHRRLPCGLNEEFLLNIYQNQTNEEEIRIKAYLEVVKCPSHQTIRAIRHTLAEENINQVGSFVWSHLHNLKVSAMPSRMEIQAMLQDSEFAAKFNKPYLKFSRNYESSFYINEYGVGGFIVSNVIFSHKTYIPRSISSNITVIIFGEAVNIAEVTLELEGFEQYVEALFWKNGILGKFEKSMNVLRFLRSFPSSMRAKADALPNVIAETFIIPKVSLSVRLFGNEIQYSRVTGKEEINNLLNNLNPVKIIKDFLSGQEMKIEKSVVLCDARYVTPLAVGLALNTDAVITTTVKLDMAGFINATAFTADGQLDLDGKLKPSIAVNMVGSMGVDAYYKSTEVKVVSKVYTSTAIAGSFKLKGYKFAWISLTLPLKKSEIFSAKNELVVVRAGQEVGLQGLTAGRVQAKICSWPVMDDALGLTFCINSLLPNTSLVLDSPMVIFNGPLNVEVTLDKSDPATQVYTLEYKLNELEDKRVLSVVFDTPNSVIKRGLTATLVLDKDGPNVTLVLQTTRTKLSAQGFYRNTPDEISLSFWLDMNGKKHIDLQIALYVKPSKYGLTYEPKLQFIINNKRIAQLSGSYKWVVKNEISQCEINIDFRTNRMSTAITGYVRKNNVSLSTNLKLDYQFDSAKPEYVRLEILVGNRSSKQITKIFGKVQLLSSTYPQINTVVHINFQKGHGHLDYKAVIKTNPFLRDENHKLVVKTELMYLRTPDGSKVDLLVEIKKAVDDIDLKFSAVAQVAPGTLSLTSVIRYSKGKEITILFDLLVPKGSLLLIESNFRVTIPNTSEAMMIHGRLHEKNSLDYDIDLTAVWFSGHNLTLKGSYEDKSTFSDTVHLLKLMARSQLFRDILLAGRLHLSDSEYKTEVTVDYSDVKYGAILQLESPSSTIMVTNAELSFNASTYSLTNYIDMASHEASIELHLDQHRDIHIKVQGPGDKLKAMLDVKWDANRDPSQKLVFTVDVFRGKHLNYEVTSVVEYPGRTITATLSLHHKESDYTGLMKLEWSATSAISVSSFLVLDPSKRGTVTFSATVLTPFPNWKATHLKYGLWVLDSSIRSNGSLCWGHNGSALLDMTYNSLSSGDQVGFSITTLLNSTIKEVSPLKGTISYTQSTQKINGLVEIESSAVHRVRLEGGGRALRDNSSIDYSAHINFKTPFQNLTNGELSANFNMDTDKNFYGGGKIALNDRNIVSSFEGSAKSLNESKLLLTIHTPFQKYQKIAGRFSFSASKAHLIAELKAAAFTLGFKTTYMFKSMREFDLQLSAMTGVHLVSSLLLVATLNNETVDVRGGWNAVLVGLTARSHYASWYDLEYRGSLFMPFEGFKESGAVAKFLYTDQFHFELAAAVAKSKVGLKALSVLRPEEEWLSEQSSCPSALDPAKNTTVLWRAAVELDTLYHPTVTCRVQLTNYDHIFYSTTADLHLNIINICIQDLFTFRNTLVMANDLAVSSSHALLSELNSKFEIKGVWPLQTVADLNLKLTSNNVTYKFDMEGQYRFQPVGNMDNEGIYSISYRLTTPFEAFDHCYLDFNLQAEKFFFSSNMTVDVVDNRLNMDGTLEVDEHYFGLTTDFSIASPSFSLPFCHLSFTKDFSAVEKNINIILKYPNNNGIADNFEVGTAWHFGGERYIKFSGNIRTPYDKLDSLHGSFLYSSEPADQEYNLEIYFKNSDRVELKLNGKTHREKVHLVIESSLEQFREIVMNGSLKRQPDDSLALDSVLSIDQSVRMDMQITSSQGVPLFMMVRLMDSRDQELVTVSVDLRRKRVHGAVGYNLLTVIQSGQHSINLEADITSRPSEDNLSLMVTSNHERYKEMSLKITVIPGKDQIFEISIHGHTDTAPLKSDFDVVCKMWFDGKKGRLRGKLASHPLSGDTYVEWEWDYLHNMKGLANASYIFHNASRSFSSLLFLTSPSGSLENICLGTDISIDNKHWWLNSNATLMVPTDNNIAFTAFLVLPHNPRELHSLVAKLHYTPDYKYINQMLRYSAMHSKLGLHTSVQWRMSDGAIDGTVVLEGGVNGAHFLRDNFNATMERHRCLINSVFTSSFTREDVTVKMQYTKPHIIHKVRVDVQSPGHNVQVLASVDFENLNNLHTNISCSTPLSLSQGPHFGVLLQAVSTRELYQRHGQLLWPNNSAMFNYTHTGSRSNSHDGSLLLDFPLASRHTVLLTYDYQIENEKSSSGVSGLVYNGNTILKGDFSRKQHVSELNKDDLIKIRMTNMYMPLGLHYQHRLKRDTIHPEEHYSDVKRVEIFKVEDSTFNITGEINVEKTMLDNTVDLNLMHKERKLRVRTVFSSNDTIRASADLVLKPAVWATTTFYLFRKHTDSLSEEHVELGLNYPRRNLSMSGGYKWSVGGLSCWGTLAPGRQSQPLASVLTWKPSGQAVLLLSHPSFEKNVTLTAHVRRGENLLLHVDAELEYALMAKRKLFISASLFTKPKKNEKNYQLFVAAKHPITRFHMELSGLIEKTPGYLFAFKNFSYARSFLPLQFWNSSMKLDLNDKLFEVQRHSLRDLVYIRTKYAAQGTKYMLEGQVLKGKTTNISGSGFVDFYNTKSEAAVNLTQDGSEQLLVSGDYVDNRHAFLNIWRRYDDLSVDDVNFYLRLNHSRLLTASYSWRTSIKQDFVDGFHAGCSYVWTYMTETADFWTDFMKTEVLDTVNEIWFDAQPVLQEFIDDVTNVDMLKSDIVYFQTVFNESYKENEFFMQDIYNITLLLAEEIAFRDKMGDLPKIVSELWQVMGETGESVRQSILYLIETVKKMYVKAVDFCGELMEGNALQQFSQLIARLSSKYDKMIKEMHVTFVNYVETLWTQMALSITDSWNKMLRVIEPAFIEFVHYVDSVFWDCSKKIFEFLYQKQSLILNSANLAKDSNFTKDLDKFYKDVTKNGFFISFQKYSIMLFGMIKDKYFKVVPFGYELTEITTEIYGEIKELYKLPAINISMEAVIAVYDKSIWLYSYFNVGQKIQQALPFFYTKVVDLSHNALQNEIINHNRKTKFVFEPRRGQLYLEQQLPMPWHSFNHVPNFQEIKEYKMITDLQKWLTPSNRTFWSLYYEYSPLADYHNWLPPYKGEAIIGKNYHFVTFDKRHFSLRSPCSYLLAKDFVRNDFALVLTFTNGKHVIDLFIGPYIVEIDLDSDMVSIPSHNMQVPANLNGTMVFYEAGIINVESDVGFSIHCNVKYDVCTVRLSGWYFGKTAGLLGTLDHEPSNDWLTSGGAVTQDLAKFSLSWLLDSGASKCLPALPRPTTPAATSSCDNFFTSKASPFTSCFPIVDPEPYYTLCHSEACTAAVMYIQHCLGHGVPLRTPNTCVKCELYSNVFMVEGDFTQLKGSAVPQSSDVVFIVEAGECNHLPSRIKNLPVIVNSVAKELLDAGIANNRFAVIVYGGDDVFSEPRNLLINNQVFGSHKHASQLLSQIPLGSGDPDIFRAIRFATKLKFRAGVSKTVILVPCSHCDGNSTSFDYSALHEVLIEKDITLHIVMNSDFGLDKLRSNRILYGVDSTTAYTKNDFKVLRGDRDLRRQVKLSKHLLGYCTPLALETNGTIFSASKLDVMNVNAAKKFVSVLAKRVAASARPSDCQNCECSADENGIDTIDCVLCVYPTPNFVDFELKDNSSFFGSLEDPTDLDYIGNDNL